MSSLRPSTLTKPEGSLRYNINLIILVPESRVVGDLYPDALYVVLKIPVGEQTYCYPGAGASSRTRFSPRCFKPAFSVKENYFRW